MAVAQQQVLKQVGRQGCPQCWRCRQSLACQCWARCVVLVQQEWLKRVRWQGRLPCHCFWRRLAGQCLLQRVVRVGAVSVARLKQLGTQECGQPQSLRQQGLQSCQQQLCQQQILAGQALVATEERLQHQMREMVRRGAVLSLSGAMAAMVAAAVEEPMQRFWC